MPERLLMLDSGAWTAWSKGKKIDLEAYARFCLDHPGVDYFVSLDVIPGSPGRKASRELEGGFLTGAWALNEDAEKSCRESWHNYRELVKALPPEKVIPVYHYGDDARWLKKYLDHGCEYVGIGGLVGRGSHDRTRFMASLRPYLLDGKGRPRVRTHGFGLTSFGAMKCWPWYSVDSSAWSFTASVGAIYVPRVRAGEFDYSAPPWVVSFSPKFGGAGGKGSHYQSLSPGVAAAVSAYRKELNAVLGGYTTRVWKSGRLAKGEFWLDRAGKEVAVPVELGLVTCATYRRRVNALFMARANEALPVRDIYLASTNVQEFACRAVRKRLMSYAHIVSPETGRLVKNEYAAFRRRLGLPEGVPA